MNSNNFQTQAHQTFSAQCFNETWNYLDSDDPDISQMLATAYASFYHWQQREDKNPSNIATAHWLLARVHFKAQQGQLCKYHADLTLKTVDAHNLAGLDRLNAFEALAKAALLENKFAEAQQFKESGFDLLAGLRAEIGETEYGYCLEDLNAIEITSEQFSGSIE